MRYTALAIRENTVYFHGTPTLPESKTRVYFDIEGLPDRDFCYLIGAMVVSDGHEKFHSFWADTQADETSNFARFTDAITQLEDFRVFHFGDYDTAAMKRMKPHLPEVHQEQLDLILGKSTNVLSALYPHVYFPTYSNSIKDIGKIVAADCLTHETTGLQSIIWRTKWETEHVLDLKAKLIEYNRTDCVLLKRLSDFVVRESSADDSNNVDTKVSHTQKMSVERPYWRLFCVKKYVLEDFHRITKCAYFDYQREKILVRTHRQFKAINRNHRRLRKTNLRPDQTITLESQRCPKCKSREIKALKERSHILIDLKFAQKGVKKWVTNIRAQCYRRAKCDAHFCSEESGPKPKLCGHGIVSWALYMNVGCGLNMGRVARSLGDLFKIYLVSDTLYRCRRYAVEDYGKLYEELKHSVLREPVLHVDETTVHLKGQNGYVWVLTSTDKVYYFFRPSREAAFLEEMLAQFTGILVSDFYTAYDSLPCAQQKCLAHFVRDIDDDLLKNPLDSEFKDIAIAFGSLLMDIVNTVDRYGLKKHHLHKHKKEVSRFLNSVGSRQFVSELAGKYQKRFQKSGSKMFTFLDYDGVPWNNNNAERAIKRFAKYRRDANCRFTEKSLKEYLVLASVLETCDFNNVSGLDFVLSKETTLAGLLGFGGRTRRSTACHERFSPVNVSGDTNASDAPRLIFSNASGVPQPDIEAETEVVRANQTRTSITKNGGSKMMGRKWHFEATKPRSATCFGGLIAIDGLIQRFDLWTRLRFERPVDRRLRAAARLSDKAVITQLLYSYCAGGVGLDDAEALGNDFLVRQLAGCSSLARKSLLEHWLFDQSEAHAESLYRLNVELTAWIIESTVASRKPELERSLWHPTFPSRVEGSTNSGLNEVSPSDAHIVGVLGNPCLEAIAGIAQNLLTALKFLYLPDNCLRLSPQSLKRRVVFLPAEVIRHARRICVRVHVPTAWQWWWQKLAEPLRLPVLSR